MKYNTLGEALQTDEGREELKKIIIEEVTQAFSAEQINAGVISLFKVLSNAGIKIIEHKDEIEALFRFAEMINSMTEDEAKAFIEEKFKDVFESHEVSENEMQEIINQCVKKPTSLILPMTKPLEKLFDGKTDLTELTGLQVATNVIVNMQVFILDSDGVQIPAYLTPFDRIVFDAICSLYEAGQKVFTSKQVYDIIAGKEYSKNEKSGKYIKSTASPQQLGAITKSIRRLMMSLLTLDWTEHARLKNIQGHGSGFITPEQNIVHLDAVHAEFYGQKLSAYKILEAPALLVHAKAVSQIATINRKLLNIPTISNTSENNVLKFYLARQIEHMKKNSSWNRTITFDTLFKNCMISGDKNYMKRRIDDVVKILDYWKTSKYISNYEIRSGKTETGERKKYYSITLDVRKPQPHKNEELTPQK